MSLLAERRFRQRAFCLLICLTTLRLPAIAADAPPARKRSFTVATFNINWGNPDLPEIVRVIRQSRADLVALQETNATSARFLRRSLARAYPHMKFHLQTGKLHPQTGRYPAGGFGFLSKVPLEHFSYLPPKDGLFGTWLCGVRVAGQSLQIVNVHLQPFLPPTRNDLSAALKMFGKVEAIHDREIRRIAEALPAQMPVIVLGDLNSPSSMTAPRFLVNQGFVDSFASVTEQPDGHPTWRWPLGRTNLTFRLDYVFHRGAVSTAKSRIIGTSGSDHWLVVSKLEVPVEMPVEKTGPR